MNSFDSLQQPSPLYSVHGAINLPLGEVIFDDDGSYKYDGLSGSQAEPTLTANIRSLVVAQQSELERLKLSLYAALQRSLDIETILTTFFSQLSPAIPITGLSFTSENGRESQLIGSPAAHSLHYQLNTGSGDCDIGELRCYSQTRINGQHVEALETAASILIFPLQHALTLQHALEQAETDALTQLGNRLALNNSLPKHIASAHRYGSPITLMMIDLDHFKTINDTHGHSAGDTTLARVAALILQELREGDTAFRYGGEEFLCTLDRTDIEGAKVAAERLRKAVENAKIDNTIAATISIGLAQLNTESEENMAALIQRADLALYEAKQQGRNCVRTR